jgi:hypothetical protein
MVANRTREIRPSGMTRGRTERRAMDKAKRARKAETPRPPSLGLRLRTPYLYPDLPIRRRITSPQRPARKRMLDDTNTRRSRPRRKRLHPRYRLLGRPLDTATTEELCAFELRMSAAGVQRGDVRLFLKLPLEKSILSATFPPMWDWRSSDS